MIRLADAFLHRLYRCIVRVISDLPPDALALLVGVFVAKSSFWEPPVAVLEDGLDVCFIEPGRLIAESCITVLEEALADGLGLATRQ